MKQTEITQIYEKFLPNVYRYAYSKLGSQAEAEDATSETFLAFVQNTKTIDNPHAWLIGTCRNIIYRRFRDKPTIQEINGVEVESDIKPLEEEVIEAELLTEIKQNLSQLDEITREIITLKIWEELKFSEIASLLDVSENTVKAKYYRELQELAEKQTKLRAVTIPLLLLAIPKLAMAAEYSPSSTLSNLIKTQISNLNLSNSSNMPKLFTKVSNLPVAVKIVIALVLVSCVVALILLAAYVNQPSQPGAENEQTSTSTTTTSSQEVTTFETGMATWYLNPQEEQGPKLMDLIDQYFPYKLEYCPKDQDCYQVVNGAVVLGMKIYTKPYAPTTKYYLVGEMKEKYPGKKIYLGISTEMPYPDVIKGYPTEDNIKLTATFATLFVQMDENTYVLGEDYDNAVILKQESREKYTNYEIKDVPSKPEVGITYDGSLSLDNIEGKYPMVLDVNGVKVKVATFLEKEMFNESDEEAYNLMTTLADGTRVYSSQVPNSDSITVKEAAAPTVILRLLSGLKTQSEQPYFSQVYVYDKDSAGMSYYSYDSKDMVWTAAKALVKLPYVAPSGQGGSSLYNPNAIQFTPDPVGCRIVSNVASAENKKLITDTAPASVLNSKINLTSDIQLAATTAEGDKVYIVTNKSWELFKYFYDNRKEVNPSVAALSYEAYLNHEPILLVQNALGVWRTVYREDMVGPVCYAEPVVYLYPEVTGEVEVRLPENLDIVRVDPEYVNSWKVFAEPSGRLKDLATGKFHKYLFWEANALLPAGPVMQNVVAREDIKTFLEGTLAKLGLNSSETKDFTDYWVPLLDKAPYYVMQFFDTKSIDKVVPLKISPEPRSVIRVLLNAIPVANANNVEQWGGNYSTPARSGFTVVEWGGVMREAIER